MLRKKILAVLAGVFFLLTSIVWAQNAPLPKTGQTSCSDGAGNPMSCTGSGQDGEYQKGVAWPVPRFTDNGDGTVTDNLTNLMWTKNVQEIPGLMTWEAALSACENLVFGNPVAACTLTDWRLPNVNELHSLVDYGAYDPSLPDGHPFTNVIWPCWTSTSDTGEPWNAWNISFRHGRVTGSNKTASTWFVWCARGGPN